MINVKMLFLFLFRFIILVTMSIVEPSDFVPMEQGVDNRSNYLKINGSMDSVNAIARASTVLTTGIQEGNHSVTTKEPTSRKSDAASVNSTDAITVLVSETIYNDTVKSGEKSNSSLGSPGLRDRKISQSRGNLKLEISGCEVKNIAPKAEINGFVIPEGLIQSMILALFTAGLILTLLSCVLIIMIFAKLSKI